MSRPLDGGPGSSKTRWSVRFVHEILIILRGTPGLGSNVLYTFVNLGSNPNRRTFIGDYYESISLY